MNTLHTAKRRQVGKGSLAGQELSAFAFQLPAPQRRQLQALAIHRGWSEAEAMRRAIAFFLEQHRDLLEVLSLRAGDQDATP